MAFSLNTSCVSATSLEAIVLVTRQDTVSRGSIEFVHSSVTDETSH